MLAAYYSKGCDSGKLFSGLKIAGIPGFQEKMNRYNLIQIDMNSEYQNADNKDLLLTKLKKKIKKEMIREFPNIEFDFQRESSCYDHRIEAEQLS